MATYVIGDIHGCKASLDRLLELIDFGTDDQLWLVGDLVNRGPRSLDVLRWAISLGDRVQVTLGNHDLYLLARAADATPRKKHCTIDQVLAAPDAGRIIDWVRHRPLFVHNDKVAIVHAGLHYSWTVPESKLLSREIESILQSAHWKHAMAELVISKHHPMRWSNALTGTDRWQSILGYFTRVRTCYADGGINGNFDGELASIPRDSLPWFALPNAGWHTHHIVFGHWAALGWHPTTRTTCVDSGCVWGQRLSALRLDDHSTVSVAACDT
jgi:bis(5'-nucleosyl)-tetraphosphatase (symmetrical)